MEFCSYSRKKHEKSSIRIWKECGWLDMENEDKEILNAFRKFIDCAEAEVAEINDEAECLVTSHSATISMLNTDIPLQAVTSVTTGRTARGLGIASRLIARTVMNGAIAGYAVSALGIFDQGFYNKMGYGCFPYVKTVSLDPLSLNVPRLKRSPIRLEINDIPLMAANFKSRQYYHGLVKLVHDDYLLMDIMCEARDGFGLGFEGNSGELTHHVWIQPEGKENGPYLAYWLVYEDLDGLLELLSLFKSLGDQINSISFREPRGIQIQDLIVRPLRQQETGSKNVFSSGIKAEAYQQARILDMSKTLGPLRLPFGHIEFNLKLKDPLEVLLPEDAPWQGLGGYWIITMSVDGSFAKRGTMEGLPLMQASVNAFSRLIFGAVPASGLAMTDELKAPYHLLNALDRLLLLPLPDMSQNF